jgi:hypothetical protein
MYQVPSAEGGRSVAMLRNSRDKHAHPPRSAVADGHGTQRNNCKNMHAHANVGMGPKRMAPKTLHLSDLHPTIAPADVLYLGVEPQEISQDFQVC